MEKKRIRKRKFRGLNRGLRINCKIYAPRNVHVEHWPRIVMSSRIHLNLTFSCRTDRIFTPDEIQQKPGRDSPELWYEVGHYFSSVSTQDVSKTQISSRYDRQWLHLAIVLLILVGAAFCQVKYIGSSYWPFVKFLHY